MEGLDFREFVSVVTSWSWFFRKCEHSHLWPFLGNWLSWRHGRQRGVSYLRECKKWKIFVEIRGPYLVAECSFGLWNQRKLICQFSEGRLSLKAQFFLAIWFKYVSVMNTAWGVGGRSGWELPFFGKQIQIQKASTSAICSPLTDFRSSRSWIRIQAHRTFTPILLPLCYGAELGSHTQF